MKQEEFEAFNDMVHKVSQEITDINTANGWETIDMLDWDDPHKIPAIIALIHSELSEALEAFRKRDKENFDDELADTVIRILALANGVCPSLADSIVKKMEFNKGRGHKHGGKFI